jgi:5'-nucleotidase
VKKIFALGALAVMAVASGCANKKPAAVTDVGPQPAAPIHDQRSPQIYQDPIQQVGYKPAANDGIGDTAVVPASGRTYTVKKGDTLWGIAQRTYGDGKQFKKIAAANPSIKGDQVNVGQKIVLP